VEKETRGPVTLRKGGGGPTSSKGKFKELVMSWKKDRGAHWEKKCNSLISWERERKEETITTIRPHLRHSGRIQPHIFDKEEERNPHRKNLREVWNERKKKRREMHDPRGRGALRDRSLMYFLEERRLRKTLTKSNFLFARGRIAAVRGGEEPTRSSSRTHSSIEKKKWRGEVREELEERNLPQ